MSFYESLDVFVGAGLMAAAPAVGCNVPPGAVAAGTGLSRFLRERGDGGRFGDILDRLAQEVWLSRDTHGIPVELAEKHAIALVDILEQCRPKPDDISAAIAAPTEAKASVAARIAVDVVSRAQNENLVAPAGILDHVAFFMLERLFLQLTVDPNLLPALEPVIAAYAAGSSASRLPAPSAEPASPAPAVAPQAAATAPSANLPAHAPDGGAMQATIEAVRSRYGISEAAMRRFIAILDVQQLKPEARASRLEELAIWLQVTTAQLSKQSNEDPAVRRLKLEAAEALSAGDFERAMERLKEIRSAVRGQRRRTQERLEDEIHQLKLQQIEEAAACARLAEFAFARGEYDSASELFAEAADSVPTTEPLLRLNYALRQADTLFRKGDSADDEIALSAAAEHYRRALASAENHRNKELAVAARCALGETLARTSRSATGTGQLREAVNAWRDALTAMDPAREPRRVANVYAALGDALYRIAERDGEETRVDQAADAYGEAVNLLDQKMAPLDWALAQLGRGTCLLRIAEREGKDRLWLDAASALVPALEVLEAEGLGEVGRHARDGLRSFHANWSRLLGKPEDTGESPRTGTLH
ncbi:MAG: hypothetical protein RLZ98_2133 [Pseudomonadota bacterium]|jgi:tetratricopeptide (TPR) repeat protein